MIEEKLPKEVSIEDAEASKKLKDILDKKAKEKLTLIANVDLNVLKKSKFFYSNDGSFREHIATYKGYAILIKSDLIKEEINTEETKMFPSLIKLEDLKKLKRVNGNVVRKKQPDSIHEYEKIALLIKVVPEIDNINNSI